MPALLWQSLQIFSILKTIVESVLMESGYYDVSPNIK
jgi:hypothetical protein